MADEGISWIILALRCVVALVGLEFAALAFRTMLVRRDDLALIVADELAAEQAQLQPSPSVSSSSSPVLPHRRSDRHPSPGQSMPKWDEALAAQHGVTITAEPSVTVSVLDERSLLDRPPRTAGRRGVRGYGTERAALTRGARAAEASSSTLPALAQEPSVLSVTGLGHDAAAVFSGASHPDIAELGGVSAAPRSDAGGAGLSPLTRGTGLTRLGGASFAANERHRLRCFVLGDRHVQFYVGCTTTGLSTGTLLTYLSLLGRQHGPNVISPVMNASTAFCVACFYTTIALLLTLLNAYRLDQTGPRVARIPYVAICIGWLAFAVSTALPWFLDVTDGNGASAPEEDTNVALYVSASISGLLLLLLLGTMARTVPCSCVQMQVALAILAAAVAFKIAVVVPVAQNWLASQLTDDGYTLLWGVVNTVPLLTTFIAVHWPRKQRRS